MLTIVPNLDHQRLLRRTSVPLPTDSGSDASGPWLEWRFTSPTDSTTIRLEQCVQRRRHDLETPISEPSSAEDPTLYLGSDSLHPLQSPLLRQLASSIGSGTQAQVAIKAWDVIRSQLRYGGYDPIDQGPLRALETGRGDCSEFSDLHVSLLRLRGIPARTPRGWTLSGNITQYHQWVEAYLPNRGWTEFDPLWATLGSTDIRRTPGLRLELSHKPPGPALDGQSKSSWHWDGEAPVFTWNDSMWQITEADPN